MKQFASDDELRLKIRKMLSRGSQDTVAKALGISQPQLNQFINGARPHASRRLLLRMGYKPKRFYQKG
jgi:predicted transcriptional regulator